jgi:hypothetical protein
VTFSAFRRRLGRRSRAPIPLTTLTLAPAERADLLVDFSASAEP